MLLDFSLPDEMVSPQQSGLDFFWYQMDTFQRSILFLDAFRQHGNDYFQYLADGQPPVLDFPYEIIMDGRNFERPVNYALARIHDRRRKGEDWSCDGNRRCESPSPKPGARPVVIIDPRSGNAPGIGGSKQASEIGVALDQGHPVYFVLFFPQPVPGQTLEDVKIAEVRFLEEVTRRHPDCGRPSVIGNSQAGWAVALMSADTPDLAGPLVLNGSPISYWAGVRGRHIVRYKAGLAGGVWTVGLWSDLGGGEFDGANLVTGNESLDPAEAFWRRPYHLYANVDTEAERFCRFARWWSSYYIMTEEEIRFMIQHLFVENRLELGEMSFQEGRRIDLKDLQDPIVLFSSDGDNITPPQQALNWIFKVWGSLAEVKRQQQVIVYMVHENIGHIGLFVSDRVANKEHAEIIGSIDMVDYLAPGLYEMVIETGDAAYTDRPYQVRFVSRTFEDIRSLDDGTEEERAFYPVAEVSRGNDLLYRTFVRPWIRAGVTPAATALMRAHHPQRLFRMMIADLNPAMWWVGSAARWVRDHRKAVGAENSFRKAEESAADAMGNLLDLWRGVRDATEEQWFTMVYGNPLMRLFFDEGESREQGGKMDPRHEAAWQEAEASYWQERLGRGGFSEALVRVLLVMAGADGVIHQEEITVLVGLVRNHPKTCMIPESHIKELIREQARILEVDPEGALESLPVLLQDPSDRFSIVEMAACLAMADMKMDPAEEALLRRIKEILAS